MWTADLGNGMYRNPILYADYSDPDAIRVGDDYYMIASSFSNSPGLPLLHSKDLVNWKVVNYIIDRIPEFRYRNPIHGCGVWAPAIRYHNGTFFVCFPMPDEGIYMTTTKEPLGKWSEPVCIRRGAGWIDPCPFWDEDGKAYLVAGVAKSRIGYKSVLHMVEMSPDGMSLIGEEKVIFDGNLNDQVTIEGPKLYKKNGWYYIFAPAGGVKTGWQTVLRSKNIYGPYEYKVVMRQMDSPVNGPHQGAWVDTVTGEDWFLHFQDVYAAGRIVHLQPMSWEDDWPVIGIKKDGDDCAAPVMEYRKPNVGGKESEVVPYCPDCSDDFSKDRLGLQWQWNANYEDDWAELTGDSLKLYAVDTTENRPVGDYRNLLLQKWPAPEFTVLTGMDITAMQIGDFAGFISLGMDYIAIGIRKEAEGLKLVKVTGKQSFDCDTAYTKEQYEEIKLDSDISYITLRYTVRRTGFKNHVEGGLPVYNAPEEEARIELAFGEDFDKTSDICNGFNHICNNAKAGRWVGVKSGVFISHNNTVKCDDKGYVLVDYVKYDK